MDRVKFKEDSLLKIWKDMVSLSRSYPCKFFKGYRPQILLGPFFLNTLSQIEVSNENYVAPAKHQVT